MTERKYIRLAVDSSIATITIDRPEKLNAIDAELLSELGSAIEEVSGAKAVRCLIITGAGKAFVAGADISAMQEMSASEAEGFALRGQAVFDAIENLHVPVIAAVNGFALGGGCELAMACDFIYASAKARFGQPEVALGVIPGFGGTQRLARRVGVGLARELIYTGDMIKADRALEIGLVNRVVDPEALLEETLTVAKKICAKGPLAVQACKGLLLTGPEQPLPNANRAEALAFGRCFDTTDQSVGMKAFLAKQDPAFTGE